MASSCQGFGFWSGLHIYDEVSYLDPSHPRYQRMKNYWPCIGFPFDPHKSVGECPCCNVRFSFVDDNNV